MRRGQREEELALFTFAVAITEKRGSTFISLVDWPFILL